MELPAALRQAVDEALARVPLHILADAVRALSERYRAEIRDGRPHLADDLAARAYLAARLPATYAAVSAVFAAIAQARPDFAPRSLLDVGAGPGTVLWAAAQVWPLADALLVEQSGAIRAFGETASAAAARGASVVWRAADVSAGLPGCGPRDLVVLAYLLNELVEDARDRLVAESWAAASDMLVLIEPGTPAGWQRLMRARAQLIAGGAAPVAPCPHAAPCPLRAPDWCHFARRVARSRLHRLAKAADVPWEDEKFIYFACSRQVGPLPDARVIAPVRRAGGQVALKLCRADGTTGERLFTRREGAPFKAARRCAWGDPLARDAEQP